MRALLIPLLILVAAASPAQQRVYRRRDRPLDAYFRTLAPAKQRRRAALYARYPKDNRRYTQGVLALLTQSERAGYVALVQAMERDFLERHPDTDPADVEVYGGYGIRADRPKSKA